HLGYALDPAHNQDHGQRRNGEIQAPGSHRILVIATQEERVIAEDTLALTQH
ncbi:MAG: propionate/acetate kinase, partial [Halomonadaceae bacterium]